jgi:hypothetical protein
MSRSSGSQIRSSATGSSRSPAGRTRSRLCPLSGETAKARTKYQDFFALWKDVDPDPDIPILKEAKAEYAKLQ